jgi:hypothetical protein
MFLLIFLVVLRIELKALYHWAVLLAQHLQLEQMEKRIYLKEK